MPITPRWALKLAALALAVAVVGLPINNATDYALLAVAAIFIFSGAVRVHKRAWLAAAAVAALAIAGQWLLAPPRIDEGHNVFLPGGADDVFARGLPADVYRHLAAEFDKQYPAAKRCSVAQQGCWQGTGLPDRTFAFSAEGIFHTSDLSRSVTALDFSDPVWLRLSFINDMRYNWNPVSDIQRASRDRRLWMGLNRWRLTMPWFEMIRLPAAYAGGELCWRGDVLWEGAGQRFALWRGDGCRAIEPADAGRRVVGVGIVPEQLAMRLEPPLPVRLLLVARGLLALAGVAGLVLLFIRFEPRRAILPFVLVGLAAAVFLGGAGLYALYRRQGPRLAGLCLGFLPVFSMALHNWMFGRELVLFSSNAAHPLVLVMPPSAYVAAFHELVSWNFSGGNLARALLQIPNWLSGPAESYWTVPLNAAGVAILVYVVVRGRRFDPWLRLIGAAALAQHAVALFYVATARYHFLTWFLTMLVVMVFWYEIGLPWLRRRYPALSERFLTHPLSRRFANGLARLQKVSA